MTAMETVLTIIAVCLAGCVVIPVLVFLVTRASVAGYYVGRFRADEFITRERKKKDAPDQERA